MRAHVLSRGTSGKSLNGLSLSFPVWEPGKVGPLLPPGAGRVLQEDGVDNAPGSCEVTVCGGSCSRVIVGYV